MTDIAIIERMNGMRLVPGSWERKFAEALLSVPYTDAVDAGHLLYSMRQNVYLTDVARELERALTSSEAAKAKRSFRKNVDPRIVARRIATASSKLPTAIAAIVRTKH